MGDYERRAAEDEQRRESQRRQYETVALATEPMMQFFAYAHLPPHLQEISKPFHAQAERVVTTIPKNDERDAGLRKLLEAKDCIVRAFLYK